MNVTPSEKAVLIALRDNYYGDVTWTNCINDSDSPSGIEGKALSGVVASLSKKRLVIADGETVGLTNLGMTIVNETVVS